MVAEGDSVICAWLPGTEEWPVIETKTNVKQRDVSVQGKDSKIKCDLDETGETTPQNTTLKADVMSEVHEVSKLLRGEKEKKRCFRPASELQRFTLVDFLPTKLSLRCGQCLACYCPKFIGNSSEGSDMYCSWHIDWQRGGDEEFRMPAGGGDDDDDDRFDSLSDEWGEKVLKAGRCAAGLKGNRRPKQVDKVTRAQRLVREKQFRSKSYLRNTGGNPIKMVRVKQDISRRNKAREERLADAIAAKKTNIERRLRLLKHERRGPMLPRNPPDKPDQTQPRQNAKPVKYELKESDVFHYAASEEEAKLLKVLALIQHRDLLPEDYDLLLRLDEKVAKRTVGSSRLRRLRTKLLTDADVKDIMNSDFAGPRCAVCMDCYYADQVVKWLPCQHVFHSNCIDMWLGNASPSCPLDGLEV